MKKTMSWILAVAMFISLFSMWSLMATAEEAPVSNLYGDVDASGSIEAKDAVLLKRHLAKWQGIAIDLTAADVDASGDVSSKDAVLLSRYLAKWTFESKIGQPINTEITGSVTLELASSVDMGSTLELQPMYEFSKTPVKTEITYTSNDSTVAEVDGNTLKAKKPGEVTLTVMVTATFEDGKTFDVLETKTLRVVSSAEKLVIAENATASYSVVYEDSLAPYAAYLSDASMYYTGAALSATQQAADSVSASGKTIVLGKSGFASALSVSLDGLRNNGYIIQINGETIIVLAKNDEGIDRGVRYLMNVCADKEAKNIKVPSDLSITEGIGVKVKNLTIAGNPITDYVVYCPEQTAEGMLDFKAVKESARVISDYIEQATGYYPDVVTEQPQDKKYFNIVLDQTGELGDEGYRIAIEDGIVTITGGVKRGNLYGAYAFIEKYLGFRIFSQQKFVYEKDALDIPNGIETEFEPTFEYRCTSWGAFSHEGSGPDYKLARGNNSHDSGAYDIQNASKGYTIGTTLYHAHSFEYQLGTPFAENPCLTKEENFEKCWASICDLLDKRIASGQTIGKELTQISVAINDNNHYCTCRNCSKVNYEEGNVAGGTLVRFVNRIAEKVEENYPGLDVYTIAYTYAKKAPVTHYRDSVIVCYCFDNACYRHPLSYDDCDTKPTTNNDKTVYHNNTDTRELFEGWPEKANKRYAWYYSASFYWYVCPLPILEKLPEDFRYIADEGTLGIYAEGSSRKPNETIYFEDLTGYLESRLIWDPYMSDAEYEQALCEYLKVHYGSGWQAIREYIRMYHEAAYNAKCFITHFDWPKTMTYIPYYGEHYDEMRALFDEAIIKADTKEQAERIKLLSTSMEFLALCAQHKEQYVNGTEEQKAAYEAHYREFWQYSRDNNIVYCDTGPTSYTAPETFDVTKNPMYWFEGTWIPAYDLENFEY